MPWRILGSLCPLRLVLGTLFHHFSSIPAPFPSIFVTFSVEFVGPRPSKNQKTASAPPRGTTPKNSFCNRPITYTSPRRTSTIDNPLENPRALRPGGTPQKTVSAIDQSYILRPGGLRRSIIQWRCRANPPPCLGSSIEARNSQTLSVQSVQLLDLISPRQLPPDR